MSRWESGRESCNTQVLRFLEAHRGEWLTLDQVTEGTGRRKGTVASALNWLGYREGLEKRKEKRGTYPIALYRLRPPSAFEEFIDNFQSACAWGFE